MHVRQGRYNRKGDVVYVYHVHHDGRYDPDGKGAYVKGAYHQAGPLKDPRNTFERVGIKKCHHGSVSRSSSL